MTYDMLYPIKLKTCGLPRLFQSHFGFRFGLWNAWNVLPFVAVCIDSYTFGRKAMSPDLAFWLVTVNRSYCSCSFWLQPKKVSERRRFPITNCCSVSFSHTTITDKWVNHSTSIHWYVALYCFLLNISKKLQSCFENTTVPSRINII